MAKSSTTKWPATVHVNVLQHHIDEGKCGNPNKCMIKLAVKHEIGGHGYVNVDASGVSATRRDDFREKAFLPRKIQDKMVAFDAWGQAGKKGPCPVKPFSFTLKFIKTSRIVKRDPEQTNARRKERKANGWKQKEYNIRSRVVGLSAANKKVA